MDGMGMLSYLIYCVFNYNLSTNPFRSHIIFIVPTELYMTYMYCISRISCCIYTSVNGNDILNAFISITVTSINYIWL